MIVFCKSGTNIRFCILRVLCVLRGKLLLAMAEKD
jgi:hypothetical protein